MKIKFKRKIRQTGATSAITLPKELLEALGWEQGTEVLLSVNDKSIIIEKAGKTNNDS